MAVGFGVTTADITIFGGQAASATGPGSSGGPDLLVTEFGARGNGIVDDTPAFQQAIKAATQSGRRLRVPAGRYRITRSLIITRGLCIEGDGVERSILLGAVAKGAPVLHVHASPTDSIMGLAISGIQLDCSHGSELCDAIHLSSGGNGAALHQAVLRNLYIINVAVGIKISGVVYRSIFDNITISKRVTEYGFYCDIDFEDITYNSFSNIEVTNVGDGAYSYWIHSNYSNFTNLTSDGCSYFSSPGGTIRNLAVEGVSSRRPASTTLIQFNQIQSVQGINLININPERCPLGIKVIGQAVILQAIRCVGPQPSHLFDLDPNSNGVIMGVQARRTVAAMKKYIPSSTLGRWAIYAS